MPETFLDAFDAPVVENVRGDEVTFPVLLLDDLIAWAARVKAQRKADGLKLVPANAPAFDRWRAEKYLSENDPAIDDLASLARTPAGAKQVLDLSLAKSGVSDARQRAATIARVPLWRLASLAAEVSRLFPPLAPYLLENPGPNPTAGGSAGGPTGLDSPEPSTGTPGNAPAE